MKSNVLSWIMFAVMLAFIFGITLVMAASPVIFRDRLGHTCGCLVDQQLPTATQCAKVDFNGRYELIEVSRCE